MKLTVKESQASDGPWSPSEKETQKIPIGEQALICYVRVS